MPPILTISNKGLKVENTTSVLLQGVNFIKYLYCTVIQKLKFFIGGVQLDTQNSLRWQ